MNPFEMRNVLKKVEETFDRYAREERENRIDFGEVDPFAVAESILGHNGAMLPHSVLMDRERTTVKNANVMADKMKVWHGDLDVTAMEQQLRLLATTLGVTIRVLYEMDARFDTAGKPRLENAVATFEPR